MSGRIVSISGATVRVALPNLRVGDRVVVGPTRLTGEVVRLDRDEAIVQIFEESRGLGRGEQVADGGGPLLARVIPVLLNDHLDLQRLAPATAGGSEKRKS